MCVRWVEEIVHHFGCLKPYLKKKTDKPPIIITGAGFLPSTVFHIYMYIQRCDHVSEADLPVNVIQVFATCRAL